MTKAAIIFAGPTLPPSAHPADPIFEWRPPVAQGDLYRAALSRPAAIGVIDGYFEVVPTVWHKEILWALTQGIAVFGAASIGALRAAELDGFGMRGVGKVYEWFRDGVLQDDDEVAVLHGPEELGYQAITDAMVDIRATLQAAVLESIVDAELGASIIRVAKDLFYKERAYPAVLKAAIGAGLPAAAVQAVANWLPEGRIAQKLHDAEALLQVIYSHLADNAPPLQVSWRLAETPAWVSAQNYVPAFAEYSRMGVPAAWLRAVS
ncbi:MAG: tfuA protein [Alphaproteobacteria bacterium]|nr:tfuA protein [Alphaproteobacteria bacterium]